MRIFILEDEIYQHPRKQILSALAQHELVVATSCEDAKEKFSGQFDLLLLDHDMRGFFDSSDFPNTGYKFCEWLVKQPFLDIPQVILHSQNPRGRGNMAKLLTQHGFVPCEFPFSQSYVEYLKKINKLRGRERIKNGMDQVS
jgi:CheY-like chemotaxis protein